MSDELEKPISASSLGADLSTEKGAVSSSPLDAMPPQLPVEQQISHPGVLSANSYSARAPRSYALEQNLSQVSLLEQLQKATSKTRAYGAPRVFDLFTLLAITLAFALLFAMLGLLAPAFDANPTDLTLFISGLVTIVGFSQMWLFGAKNPRLASLVSGPFALAVVLMFPFIATSDHWLTAVFASFSIGILFGPFAGYLAGAVVAGVFLVADKFRMRFMQSSSATSSDASFDDLM